MKREKPSKQELRKALASLKYEEDMLKATADGLNSGLPGNNLTIHNALVESFVIHARLLTEFLYRDEPYKDNIMAKDFFSPPQAWTYEIRPPKGKLLDKTEKDAHKFLAHLTYTRLLVKKKWPYKEIVNEIAVRLDKFRNNLPKDLLGSLPEVR